MPDDQNTSNKQITNATYFDNRNRDISTLPCLNWSARNMYIGQTSLIFNVKIINMDYRPGY